MEIQIRIKTPSRWREDLLTPKLKELIPEAIVSKKIKRTTKILITNYLSVREVNRTDKLKYLIIPTSGTENIPLEFVSMKGIKIIQNKKLIAKNVVIYTRDMINKLTKKSIRDSLNNKHILLLGYGVMGQELYNWLSKYHCSFNILTNKIFPEADYKEGIDFVGPLQELGKVSLKSDIILNTLPKKPDTKDLFKRYNAKLKEGSLVVNLSRSGILNEREILLKVKEGIYSGAIFDVYSKDINEKNYKHPRIILTPHIAGIYNNGAKKIAMFIAKEVKRIKKIDSEQIH